MQNEEDRVSLADALRVAIRSSGVSYNALRRRTGVTQGQLSRFMTGERDLTLASASRIALVLGYELVQTGTVLDEKLADPTPTTLRRHQEGLPMPTSTDARGRGRRMDLEAADEGADKQDAAEQGVEGKRRRQGRTARRGKGQ